MTWTRKSSAPATWKAAMTPGTAAMRSRNESIDVLVWPANRSAMIASMG